MGRKALADVMVIVTAISMGVMEAVLIMETMTGLSNHVVVS